MSGVKILHTGDLHIGASRTGVKNGRNEILNTFLRIITLCKREQIDFLLIAGDLLDTPFPDSDTANGIIHAMAQIPETVIAISPGNHDYACVGSFYLNYEFPENVVIFTSFTEHMDFPDKNVRLFGAGFTDKYERLPLLSPTYDMNPETINICVLHGDLISLQSDSDYNPITKTAIADSGYDYLALGHIHKRSPIEKEGDTFYSYCGCPDGHGFDETDSLGVYLGTVGKGFCNLEYKELSSRKYIITKTDISDCNNSPEISSKILEHIKSSYPDDFQNHLYRVSLTGCVSPDFLPNTVQIEESLRDELLYIQISDLTEPSFSEMESLSCENSLRGIFVAKMLEMIKNSEPRDEALCKQALRLGLKAFERGVNLNDN